ncbi:hypothetical protein VAPA_1c44830 [Variovorax paradoxus B4]|uniref:Uncharacterized protein n=1 Tax=Variovorax paradoxus B4 TaxID=1246301 RepID=T1XGB0_VARPD|nr:hypothetical protein [Variovorax paradoxus]AGU51556.1 hypothetical protein VAPA_1c44830 [Variovorax paradoxus B4]
MTTTTTGVFFVGKDRPGRPAVSEHTSNAGEFVLKMRVVDNQGPRAVEVYVVRWIGPSAAAWRAQHRNLKAGDALRLELTNPRSMPGAQAPEIHAAIKTCEPLPARAPAIAQAA